MRQSDIAIGGLYWTRVSGELTRVRVLRTVERFGRSRRTLVRFAVARPEESYRPAWRVGRRELASSGELPKPRPASALHLCKHRGFADACDPGPGQTHKACDACLESSERAQECARMLWSIARARDYATGDAP